MAKRHVERETRPIQPPKGKKKARRARASRNETKLPVDDGASFTAENSIHVVASHPLNSKYDTLEKSPLVIQRANHLERLATCNEKLKLLFKPHQISDEIRNDIQRIVWDEAERLRVEDAARIADLQAKLELATAKRVTLLRNLELEKAVRDAYVQCLNIKINNVVPEYEAALKDDVEEHQQHLQEISDKGFTLFNDLLEADMNPKLDDARTERDVAEFEERRLDEALKVLREQRNELDDKTCGLESYVENEVLPVQQALADGKAELANLLDEYNSRTVARNEKSKELRKINADVKTQARNMSRKIHMNVSHLELLKTIYSVKEQINQRSVLPALPELHNLSKSLGMTDGPHREVGDFPNVPSVVPVVARLNAITNPRREAV
eukprot:CFRG4565T1